MSLPNNEMAFHHPLFRKDEPHLMRDMRMLSYITSGEKKEKAARIAEEAKQADSKSSRRNTSPPPEPVMVGQQQQPPSVTLHTPLSTLSSFSPLSIQVQIPAVTAPAQDPTIDRLVLGLLPMNEQSQQPTLVTTQASLHHQAQLVQQILANQQLLPQLQQELIRQVLGIQQQQTQQLQLSSEVVMRTLLPQLQPSPTVRPAPIVSMPMPLVGRTTTSSSAATATSPVLSALSNAPGVQAPGLALDPVTAAAIRLLLQQQTQARTPLTPSPSIDDHSSPGPILMQLLQSAVEQQLQHQQTRQREEEAILQILLATLQRGSSSDGGAQL
jgi:hypothetical protein